MDTENRYDESELIAVFDKLFPNGFAGADVRKELAPNSWEASPLFALFHPSPQKRYEEALAMHRNLARLRKHGDDRPESPEPTLAEIAAEQTVEPVAVEEELCRLVGMALWDIFSDNHEVFDDEGRVLDLGSFRASGGFLADALNRQIKAGLVADPGLDERNAAMEEQLRKLMPAGSGSELFLKMMKAEQTGPYGYMDFYMGTGMIAGRADLTPVYRMIFTRLRALDFNWRYVFPRIYAVDMRPLKESLDAQKREESGEPEWENYDPAASFEKEEADRKKDEEISEMREKLDEGYRESVEAALQQPPPTTVLAYELVYGEWPEGWPPVVE